MSLYRPFSRLALAAGLFATLIFPAGVALAQAQAAQSPMASSTAQSNASAGTNGGNSDAMTKAEPNGQTETKNVAAKAIDTVKAVAKTAGDIFSRVPCLSPKGGMQAMGPLPHVAAKLATGKPVVIVAFGSSSTQGYGSTSPEFTYPNRLAAQLRRSYPGANITVLNRGKGGEDAPEMMGRLQNEVISANPDLVIWQVGTNAVLRNLDPNDTGKMIDDGVARIQAAGADIVLVDPQYSPLVNTKPEGASKMIALMHKVATLRHIGIFPRFDVMREWHEGQAMPFDSFVIADGLHMNDWGYACFAQLLGDNIVKSVGQIKLGVNTPTGAPSNKPL